MEPFRFEDSGDSPGFLLWQLTTLWQHAIQAALAPYGVTHIQFVLLASLAWLEKSGVVVSQVVLARHARTDIMMTSQVLRTLEDKGLCRRETHPSDSRARRVLLTDAGRQLVEQTVPQVEAVDAQFFEALGARGKAFGGDMQTLIAEHTPHRPNAR